MAVYTRTVKLHTSLVNWMMLQKLHGTFSASTHGSIVAAQLEQDAVQGGLPLKYSVKGSNKSSGRHTDQLPHKAGQYSRRKLTFSCFIRWCPLNTSNTFNSISLSNTGHGRTCKDRFLVGVEAQSNRENRIGTPPPPPAGNPRTSPADFEGNVTDSQNQAMSSIF